MSDAQTKFVYAVIFGMVVALALYQAYFWPSFYGNEPLISRDLALSLVICVSVAGLVGEILLYIDIYHRDLESKQLWVLYIFFVNPIGFIHYFLKHGRRPRKNAL